LHSCCFLQKKILSEGESKLVEQQLAEESKLLKEQENMRELVFNLVRMTQIKSDEREQKSKDFLKAQVTACMQPFISYYKSSGPYFSATLIRKLQL
jgi:hypothetical protein